LLINCLALFVSVNAIAGESKLPEVGDSLDTQGVVIRLVDLDPVPAVGNVPFDCDGMWSTKSDPETEQTIASCTQSNGAELRFIWYSHNLSLTVVTDEGETLVFWSPEGEIATIIVPLGGGRLTITLRNKQRRRVEWTGEPSKYCSYIAHYDDDGVLVSHGPSTGRGTAVGTWYVKKADRWYQRVKALEVQDVLAGDPEHPLIGKHLKSRTSSETAIDDADVPTLDERLGDARVFPALCEYDSNTAIIEHLLRD